MPISSAVERIVAETTTAELAFTVNGHERHLDLDPRTSLLDALREHLHLTGTKKGCDHGQCGACTVLINGRRINSCLTLAVMHEGDDVVTIEGLGSPGALHPMQAAFVELAMSRMVLANETLHLRARDGFEWGGDRGVQSRREMHQRRYKPTRPHEARDRAPHPLGRH
jgi:2Fe-2S iron-sulfur cluster protein